MGFVSHESCTPAYLFVPVVAHYVVVLSSRLKPARAGTVAQALQMGT